MLITPHMHCVGLVLVAVLISSVHAIPTPPPETPLPSEFLHHSYLQEFKFPFGHPGTPANPIHFSDAPPHAESEALLESEWSTLFRITMLAHTKHGDQKLEGFTVLPHPKPMRPLKLGSDDRRQISAGIRRAMGKDLFPPGCSRYTNDHPSEDTASTSQVKSTKADGIWMFVLEGLKDICKVSPCVGWRMELEGFQYTWVHELNPEVTEDQKPMRYANTKPRTTDDKWDELDKQFWDQFPREKFEDPQWWAVQKKENDVWDRKEMKAQKDKGVAATAASKEKTSQRHVDVYERPAKLRKLEAKAPTPPPGHSRGRR